MQQPHLGNYSKLLFLSLEIETSINSITSERVKVAVRVRPSLIHESSNSCIEYCKEDPKSIMIKKDYEIRQFTFDYVFNANSTQELIHNLLSKQVVQSVLQGINGTIFSYGATGTGKTYTMAGLSENQDRGVIPRSIEQLLEETEQDKHYTCQLKVAYLQIYIENLQDLLNPESTDIKIRESPENGIFLSGLEWVTIESYEQFMNVFNFGNKNKITAFTQLNSNSSRAHTILMTKVEKKKIQYFNQTPQKLVKSYQHSISRTSKRSIKSLQDESIDLDSCRSQAKNVSSILYLVDLAGSERIKKSKGNINETKSINSSLSTLGKCIHALTDQKQNFIPFRDSKLTRILQDSLGGNCKTILLLTIAPLQSQVEENLSTLFFGMRAMKIQNTPRINRIMESKNEVLLKLENSQSRLMQQVSKLQTEVQSLKNQQDDTSSIQESDYNSQQYKNQIYRMEEEHKVFLVEIDKLMMNQEKQNEELKNTVMKSTQEQEQAYQRIIELEDQLDKLMEYKDELLRTIQELHQKNSDKESQIRMLKNKSEHWSDFQREESDKKYHLSSRNTDLTYEHSYSEQDGNTQSQSDINNQMQQLIKEKQQLQQTEKQLKQSLFHNKLMLQESEQQHQSELKVIQQNLEEKYKKVKDENDQLRQQVNIYQSENTEQQEELHKLKNELQENNQQRKLISQRLGKYEQDLYALSTEYNALHQQVMNDKQQKQQEVQQIDRIINKIKEQIGYQKNMQESNYYDNPLEISFNQQQCQPSQLNQITKSLNELLEFIKGHGQDQMKNEFYLMQIQFEELKLQLDEANSNLEYMYTKEKNFEQQLINKNQSIVNFQQMFQDQEKQIQDQNQLIQQQQVMLNQMNQQESTNSIVNLIIDEIITKSTNSTKFNLENMVESIFIESQHQSQNAIIMEDSNESVLTEKENLMENMLENSLLKSSVIEYQTSKNDKKNLFSFSDEQRNVLGEKQENEQIMEFGCNSSKKYDIERFFKQNEFDKHDLLLIISKLLDCAEYAHQNYFDKLANKTREFVQIEELESAIQMLIMSKRKFLKQY